MAYNPTTHKAKSYFGPIKTKIGSEVYDFYFVRSNMIDSIMLNSLLTNVSIASSVSGSTGKAKIDVKKNADKLSSTLKQLVDFLVVRLCDENGKTYYKNANQSKGSGFHSLFLGSEGLVVLTLLVGEYNKANRGDTDLKPLIAYEAVLTDIEEKDGDGALDSQESDPEEVQEAVLNSPQGKR